MKRLLKFDEWLFEEGNAQMGITSIDNPGGYIYNPVGEEEEEGESNYMFFSNLKRIKELSEMILKIDKAKVDEMLNNGHDWANTHVNTAKTNLDHVFEFFQDSVNRKMNEEEDKTAESISDFERKYAMTPVWWAAWREENEKKDGLKITKDAFSKTYEIRNKEGKLIFIYDYGRSSVFTNLAPNEFKLKEERTQKEVEKLEKKADKIRGTAEPKKPEKEEKKDDPLAGLGI